MSANSFSKNCQLIVFWDLRYNQLWQWLEEGCHKPVFGVCLGKRFQTLHSLIPWHKHKQTLHHQPLMQTSNSPFIHSLTQAQTNTPPPATHADFKLSIHSFPDTSTNKHSTASHSRRLWLSIIVATSCSWSCVNCTSNTPLSSESLNLLPGDMPSMGLWEAAEWKDILSDSSFSAVDGITSNCKGKVGMELDQSSFLCMQFEKKRKKISGKIEHKKQQQEKHGACGKLQTDPDSYTLT